MVNNSVTMENNGSDQVGARLPPFLLRWIRGKVHTDKNPGGEYKSMSQAIVGELTKAKICDDLGLLSPCARQGDNYPSQQTPPICLRGELCNETP